jgi:hypothetical protein
MALMRQTVAPGTGILVELLMDRCDQKAGTTNRYHKQKLGDTGMEDKYKREGDLQKKGQI